MTSYAAASPAPAAELEAQEHNNSEPHRRTSGVTRSMRPSLLQVPPEQGHQSSAVARSQLPQQVGDVDLDGALAQPERGGDLLVRLAERHRLQHLHLAAGELAHLAGPAQAARQLA